MANHTARLYAVALSLVAFFLAWAVVAARPWATQSSQSPRLQALSLRAAELRREAKLVNEIVALRARTATTAAPAAATTQAVRVVNLPPVTITRTS
jgi:hypothetical protein